MDHRIDTYDEVRRAIDDARTTRNSRSTDAHNGNGRWPQWIQTVLAVVAVVASVVLAYAALDKRISLLELKLDYIVRQVGGPRP